MPRTALVTGGAGFIGSHLSHALVRQGWDVRVLDNLCTGSWNNLEEIRDDIDFFEADLCDEPALEQATRGVEVVFHQAALASVPLSIEKPLEVHRACATGTLCLLQAARQAGVRRVVYAGSSSCYGDQPFSANRETDHLKTLSPYATAKLAGEFYCQAFYETFGLETVVLRYFNVFGPRQDPNSPYSAVIPLFITRLLSGQRPVIYGDGYQSRDFTFVENVVNGNLMASEVPAAAGKTFNLAAGQSTRLLTLLDSLSRLLDVQIEIDFQPARPGDIKDSQADISQAVSLLGYSPRVNLDEGLRRSIAYYRSLALNR